MTVFLDTAVFMYAAGAAHPLRAQCQAIVTAAGRGDLDATTSAEVVQEVLHRFSGTERAADGARLARSILTAFRPVLALDQAVATRTVALSERYPAATARDLVHVAACLEHRIARVVTPDRDFDAYDEVTRIDPEVALDG